MGADTHFKVRVVVHRTEWIDVYALSSMEARRQAFLDGHIVHDVKHIDEYDPPEKRD